MKVFIFLCLTNLALANAYYVVRRGIPSRRLPSRQGIPTRAGINNRVVPSRSVGTKAVPESGENNASNPEKPSATIRSKGPARIYAVDEHGRSIHRDVVYAETAIKSSGHTTAPQVGGVTDGPPAKDDSLTVTAKGRHALIKAETGLGGSLHYESIGKDLTRKGKLGEGEGMMASAFDESGKARAEVTVSRPGTATAIAVNHPSDLDPEKYEEKSGKKDKF